MADNTNKRSYFKIDETVSLVGNIIAAIICLALVLPVFFKNIHTGYQYILICIGLMLLSGLFVFLNIRQNRPALRILPRLAFCDVLIYVTLFFANVIKVKNITTFSAFTNVFHLSDFFDHSASTAILIITAIVFITFSLFAFANKYSDSFTSILITLESIVLSLLFAWKQSVNSSYGRVVLSISIVVSFIWLFICSYSNVVTTGEKRGTAFYSLIFSVILLILNFFFAKNNAKGLNVFFVIPETITDSVARKMYPWWLAILLTVVFIAGGTFLAVLADGEDDVRNYVDAKFFYAVAILAFLSKLILSNYFAYSFVLYIGILIILNADIKKDIGRIDKKDKNDRYYDVEDFTFRSLRLLYISICSIFIIQIAENMLYLTLAIALILMYMLYKLLVNFTKKEILEDYSVKSVLDGLPKSYHFAIVVLAATLTASLVYYYRFSIGNFILLAIMVVTVMLVFTAVKRKLPNNIKLSEIKTVKWIATLFVIIVCIVLTSSSGAKLKMEYNESKTSTTISVSTNKKTTINKIEYKWDNGLVYDGYQMLAMDADPILYDKQISSIKGKKRETEFTLPVQGENLTIWITDANGVQTTRTLWYPTWYDNKFD